ATPAMVCPTATVISRTAPTAVRAAIPLAPARPDRDHDRVVLVELDALDHRLLQSQQPRPRADAYASAAHTADRSFPRFLTVRSRNRRSAAACAPSCPGSGASLRPDLVATQRGTAAAVTSA